MTPSFTPRRGPRHVTKRSGESFAPIEAELPQHVDERPGPFGIDREAGWARPSARGTEELQGGLGPHDAAERLGRLEHLQDLRVDAGRGVAVAGDEPLDQRDAQAGRQVALRAEVALGAERERAERMDRA